MLETAHLDDAGASALSEAQGGDLQLRHVQQTCIISHSAHNDCDLILALALQVASNARECNGWSVHTAGNQSLDDNLVEVRASAASEEAVQLHMRIRTTLVDTHTL